MNKDLTNLIIAAVAAALATGLLLLPVTMPGMVRLTSPTGSLPPDVPVASAIAPVPFLF